MSSKKAFTILELIIVIGIISLSILSLRNIFQNDKKDTLYAESCINKIYGDLNNYLTNGLTNKSIIISGTRIRPTEYSIEISPQNQNIIFSYITSEGTGIWKNIDLQSGNINFCKTESYNTQLSGEKIHIEISKDQEQTMIINTDPTKTTTQTVLQICNPENTTCKELSKINIDTRTTSIYLKACFDNDDNGICTQWRE